MLLISTRFVQIIRTKDIILDSLGKIKLYCRHIFASFIVHPPWDPCKLYETFEMKKNPALYSA